ncbi:NUDIX hydrolase [Jeotgalibacillus marinus]|uniref:NUDIX domain-containing protein n=1 Tax=Jeotgalibacillus marinus TaxID=86667 RepID=A0ABV3Q5H6_9BACL
MDTEKINIFDEDNKQLGVATREEVHRIGHWHETFHCWFISTKNDKNYIHFQIRSDDKKDFPNLLDITAAGHILANETIADGIREVKEELGIDVSFGDLFSLGVIKDRIIQDDFIDKELGNVFLYRSENTLDDEYELQSEEVSGVVKAEFKSFYELCLGEKEEIKIEGFEITNAGEKILINKSVSKKSFLPHEKTYFERVIKLIKEELERKHDKSTTFN